MIFHRSTSATRPVCLTLLALATTLTLPACAPSPADQSGAALFAARCASCHGPAGDGDGPAAQGLNPRPRKLRDTAWLAGVSDEQLRRTITGGGAAVGKSALMPPQPDLLEHPKALSGLVDYVRGLPKTAQGKDVNHP